MRAEQRLWRTGDGRLVVDGDPNAATLAYTPGDDIAPRDEDLATEAVAAASDDDAEGTAEPKSKAAKAPANKSRQADNK
jgi:hypothetical protein